MKKKTTFSSQELIVFFRVLLHAEGTSPYPLTRGILLGKPGEKRNFIQEVHRKSLSIKKYEVPEEDS